MGKSSPDPTRPTSTLRRARPGAACNLAEWFLARHAFEPIFGIRCRMNWQAVNLALLRLRAAMPSTRMSRRRRESMRHGTEISNRFLLLPDLRLGDCLRSIVNTACEASNRVVRNPILTDGDLG